jgi:surfeit locus 1 family protein
MFKHIALIPSLAALLLVVLTVNLGAWQLRRADEKRTLQSQRESMARSVPAPWELGGASNGVQSPPVAGQSILLRGEFLEHKTVFLDNRSRNGMAGLHVLTPLRLVGSTGPTSEPVYVLVLRGWVARPRGEHSLLPTVKPLAGLQNISGLVQMDLGKAPYLNAVTPSSIGVAWPHLTLAQYKAVSELPIQPFLLRQFSSSPDDLLRDWPAPANEIDKHLGYAFQWFALALTVIGLWLYFSLIKPPIRPRPTTAVQ